MSSSFSRILVIEMNSEKPSPAERIGAGFRNVQKYTILEQLHRLETICFPLISYLRGRKFPGAVRFRRRKDREFEKMNIAVGDVERNSKSKTNSANILASHSIKFEEQVFILLYFLALVLCLS